MTGTLRTTARNPVAIALMGILILVFLILGVGGGGKFPDAFRAARADAVVNAGSHVMTASDYRKIFEQQKQHYEVQSKQPTTTEFLIRNGFDQQLLSQIAMDEGEVEMLTRIGVVPDPSLVDAQIRQIPVAFDRVTGKFSEKQFTEFLAAQGLTPRQVQSDLTDELAGRHFAVALEAGFREPRAYAALTAITALQNRDISYFELDPRAVVQPAAPTDAQLLAFLKANAAQLTRPEMRTISLAQFSAVALAATATVSDADIQKEFNFRKDTLSTPETRSIVQIAVRNAADGAQAAHRLTAGEDPAAVARSLGEQPILYDNKPRAAIADAKVAAAAFAMTAGQVNGPVQGDLGLAVVKVIRITPPKVATLDSAKPAIVADLKARAAQNQAYQLSQKFDEARQGGSSVADAAQKAGVTVATVGPFTADGLGLDGRPVPGLSDKIAKAAFAMRQGEDSDVQEAAKGEYFALKVAKVTAPALPPLDEVRGPLTQAVQRQALIAALKAKAEALVAALNAGKPIDEVAATVGAKVIRQPGMRIVQAEQYKTLGRDFLTQIFGRKQGEVFDAAAQNGVYIAKIDAVRAGDVGQTAQFLESIRQRASQEYLRDLVATTKDAAEKAMKVSVNLNLARQTMGVDPATLPAQPNANAKSQ